MNIYMGYSIFGEDIYVDKEDYKRATDLLNDLSPDNVPDYTEECRTDYKTPFYRNPPIVARIILIAMVSTIIFFTILNSL